MENKLAITIVALMVVALAAPAVMADDTATYSATVSGAANVVVTPGSDGTAFGDLLAGETETLTDSLILTNNGNAPAKVEAKFTTVDGDYGLTGLTSGNVIPGTKFKLGGIALKATDDQTEITASLAGSGGTVTYSAELDVPVGQAADVYDGNVLLTFT